MNRKLLLLATVIATLPLMGQTCTPVVAPARYLVSPATGSTVVANVLSPVYVKTSGLRGVGYIEAFATDGAWHVIHLSPNGPFLFNEPLMNPGFSIWHCDPANGAAGCVARLRAGDEVGVLRTSRPGNVFYVCTEDYVQKVGRRHCGGRALQDAYAPLNRIPLAPAQTQAIPSGSIDLERVYDWEGDPWNRLVTGWEVPGARLIENYNPPTGTTLSGVWAEQPWEPDSSGAVRLALGPEIVSYDLGASWIFFPHEWKDRIRNNLWTDSLGFETAALDADGTPIANADGSFGRGFAEVLLDGLIDSPRTSTYTPDVKLWLDAVTNIGTRAEISPEFHFSVGPTGLVGTQPRLCLRQYLWANNDIRAMPDAFYRWDQAIVSAFVELLGLGDCRTKPVSAYYCGWIDIDMNGVGRYQIFEPSIVVAMEGYSVFKPSCNNQFVPEFKRNFKEGLRTQGARNLSDGIAQMTERLATNLGIQVRRLVLTPSGVYIVTAETMLDTQYGVGNTQYDLETQGTSIVQPAITKQYSSRGIRRF